MTSHADLILIIIATAAATAAVIIPIAYLLGRSKRRALVRARNKLAVAKIELWDVRTGRANLGRAWCEHVEQATQVATDGRTHVGPIPYTVVEHDPYLPVFTAGRAPASLVDADLNGVETAIRGSRHRAGVR